MTTIGYATLQIIPSLKGVTEAIEKQVDGKVVEVKVAPKVDPKAADTAGKQVKDAVEKQTTDVKVTPKVDQKAADTAGKETKAAVEKQTSEVKVAPKVDEKAAADAGKKTRETVEKQTKEIQVKPKVDQKAAEKVGKDTGEAVTKGTKDAVRKGDIGEAVGDEIKDSVKKSNSVARETAKVLVDGLADGVKAELNGGALIDVLVEGLAAGVKQGIDDVGIGGQIVRTIGDAHIDTQLVKSIGDAIKSGNLGKTIKDGLLPGIKAAMPAIKDAVVPGIKGIGEVILAGAGEWASGIGEALRSGDIQGATDDIGNAVIATTDIIANIGSTFGLQLDGVREFGTNSSSTMSSVAGSVQSVVDKANEVSGTFEGVGTLLETVLPGKAKKGAGLITAALASITAADAASNGGKGGALDALLMAAGGGLTGAQIAGLPGAVVGTGIGIGAAFTPALINGTDPNAGPMPTDPRTGLPAVQSNAPANSRDTGGAPVNITGLPEAQAKAPASTRDSGGVPAVVLGPDGKPIKIPGLSSGGYTGNWAIDQVAGVVHGAEFVVKASSQKRIENAWPGLLDYMNNTGRLPGLPGYADGGLVDNAKRFAASMDPAKYLMGGFSPGAIDCSGFVSAVVNVATGRPPFQSRMSTSTEGSWLASLGFKPGRGGGGDLRVGWWDRGGGANGHTAGTLPDGTNFESNSSEGVVIGGKTGADDKQFTRHAYLPVTGIGNPNGSRSDATSAPDMLSTLGLGTGSGSGGSSAASTNPAASPSGGGGFTLASSISGLSSVGLGDLKGPQTGPGKRTFDYGKAVSSAVEGQVSSALSVFGVPDSPGWLQGLSQFVGGISIGGGDDGYGGAAPISLGMDGAHAPGAAENMHSGNAGQQPGVTYNIRTATVEDAFTQAQRRENVRLASKLDRY